MDDIGEARAGKTVVGSVGNMMLRWDFVVFRRGTVGVALIVVYPDRVGPAMPIGDIARMLDVLVSNYLGLATLRTVTVVIHVTVPTTTDATGRKVYIAGSFDLLDKNMPR